MSVYTLYKINEKTIPLMAYNRLVLGVKKNLTTNLYMKI